MTSTILDSKTGKHNKSIYLIRSVNVDTEMQFTIKNFHLNEQIYVILSYDYSNGTHIFTKVEYFACF